MSSAFPCPPVSPGGASPRPASVRKPGASVIGVRRNGGAAEAPDLRAPLEPGSELIVIGDTEAERRFLAQYGG